jgi:hypothetical protein
LARHIPCLERENRRRLGGAADGENADFLADQVFGLANLFLRHEAVGKRIERTGEHHHVGALVDRGDSRRRVDLSEVNTAAL